MIRRLVALHAAVRLARGQRNGRNRAIIDAGGRLVDDTRGSGKDRQPVPTGG
jgi:hypothetical protein